MPIDEVRMIKKSDIDGGAVAGEISRKAASDEPEFAD